MALNKWAESTVKRKEQLYDLLPANFYKLLEMMTIARSRKHITTCYGTDKVGTFPEKLKPDTYTPHIDVGKDHRMYFIIESKFGKDDSNLTDVERNKIWEYILTTKNILIV